MMPHWLQDGLRWAHVVHGPAATPEPVPEATTPPVTFDPVQEIERVLVAAEAKVEVALDLVQPGEAPLYDPDRATAINASVETARETQRAADINASVAAIRAGQTDT